MTLIERWVCVCPEHGVSPQAHTRAFPEHGCWFWSTDDSHCRAEVEWVRLTSDRGAVGELEALREAVRAYLNGAPLDEHGRFKNARLEPLYRALTKDSSG